MATIASLPTEIVGSILSYLNIQSLLSFSATSKDNQLQARYSLLRLDLAVLPRQVHCSLALASQYCRDEVQGDIDPPQFGIGKITHVSLALNKENPNPATIRQIQIQAQNQIATDILTQQSVQNLQSLTLHMYDVQSGDLADTIGRKLPHLRNLELNFCHPFIHNSATSSSYWRHASEGTPCWNSLVGLGVENQRHLHLQNLQSLKVDRAGLTSAQLRKLVESNSGLRILSLTNVTGVDLEFLNWLARRTEDGKSNIQILKLENCPKLVLQRLKDFACIFGLAYGVIEYISLQKCPNIKEQVFEDLANENCTLGGEFRAFKTFVLPTGRKSHYGSLDSVSNKVQEGGRSGLGNWTSGKIDVDPGYPIQPVAVTA